MNDVAYEFSFDPSEIKALWLSVDHRMAISARVHPLRSIDRLRQAVKDGHRFASTVALLNHLLNDQGDVLALDAMREGMRLLPWSPYSCRRAELGNGRSRELIVPFGATGYIVLFEIVGDDVAVGALRHQREEDYQH